MRPGEVDESMVPLTPPDGVPCVDGALKRSNGYARVVIDGITMRQHRVAFFRVYGWWPESVMHRCDNPPCVEPEHLAGGTHAVNMADRRAKGRYRANDGCFVPKLSDDDVAEIRRRYADDPLLLQRDLAGEFQVTVKTIKQVTSGRGRFAALGPVFAGGRKRHVPPKETP